MISQADVLKRFPPGELFGVFACVLDGAADWTHERVKRLGVRKII